MARVAIWTTLGWLAFLLAYLAGPDAFSAEPAAPDAAALEFFEKQVRPLLVTHCYECHSGDEANGGLLLDSRDGVTRGGDTGPAIVPGDPERSLLIEAVRYKNLELQMPPDGALSSSEIKTLEKWVARGAPDSRKAGAAAVTTGPVGMSIEEGREFWSFRPLADLPLPAVRDSSWVRTPVDAFVLARLEQHGLRPAPPADRRTLIRRVTFDLTGLPPTAEQVEAFLADTSTAAYQKLVDRLLASPHYGIRWGRHWLDVARYADSNGLDENLAYGNAWRYRDYVVEAFNSDKPFDRFLVEQLAGDLVPDADRETKTATGFLVLGAKVLAEPDEEKLVMDTIDEQLDTTGKAIMAMTLGCVRCHDHKFDPLKQTDYYGLAAIFKSTKTFGDTKTGVIKHWNEHSFASEDELAKLKEIDAKIAEKNSAASTFKSKAMARLRDEARAKATEYLVAAAGFDPSMPLTQVELIARPLGLHSRILHHCRLHLAYNRDDPFFGKWHQLAAAGDLAGIEQHFRPLFEQAEAALAAARKESAKATTIADQRLESARAALYDPSGFLAVPPKPEFAFDAETLAEYYRLMEEARIVESNAPDAPAAMGVTDATVLTSLPIHIRGSHRNLGEPVARGFPEVMRLSNEGAVLPDGQSGRLELARWLTSRQHPLTARVYVNRIWRWHFGAGIVKSTENFGKLGDRPSHPDLLDWLARHFMQSGWSTKQLHRLILCSSTYQMASAHPSDHVSWKPAAPAKDLTSDAAGTAGNSAFATENSSDASRGGVDTSPSRPADTDPENSLLWKFRLQRLAAEEIRDSILAVSGRLDESMGGKTIPLRNRQFVFNHTSVDHTKYDSLRRAIYLPVVRNNIYTLFEQFDFPDPTMPTGSRNSTVVAPQALLLMNSDLVMDSAEHLARKLLEETADDAGRVELAYRRSMGRPPTEQELQRALAFVGGSTGSTTGEQLPECEAWALFCQSLFASNEFIYLR